jgi:hypothetical protein
LALLLKAAVGSSEADSAQAPTQALALLLKAAVGSSKGDSSKGDSAQAPTLVGFTAASTCFSSSFLLLYCDAPTSLRTAVFLLLHLSGSNAQTQKQRK